MQQGLLGRISRTGIMEYHAFGIIRRVKGCLIYRSSLIRPLSEGTDAQCHYMVCGVQGDS